MVYRPIHVICEAVLLDVAHQSLDLIRHVQGAKLRGAQHGAALDGNRSLHSPHGVSVLPVQQVFGSHQCLGCWRNLLQQAHIGRERHAWLAGDKRHCLELGAEVAAARQEGLLRKVIIMLQKVLAKSTRTAQGTVCCPQCAGLRLNQPGLLKGVLKSEMPPQPPVAEGPQDGFTAGLVQLWQFHCRHLESGHMEVMSVRLRWVISGFGSRERVGAMERQPIADVGDQCLPAESLILISTPPKGLCHS
mmetsp:Transcript_22325/g.56118  ORF Transcript_22325/g.56118 Transcript_22325/m.56118 type:complete len:247 (+) Transcript_22325:7804-8544(+)